jgi:hypothetical protein
VRVQLPRNCVHVVGVHEGAVLVRHAGELAFKYVLAECINFTIPPFHLRQRVPSTVEKGVNKIEKGLHIIWRRTRCVEDFDAGVVGADGEAAIEIHDELECEKGVVQET